MLTQCQADHKSQGCWQLRIAEIGVIIATSFSCEANIAKGVNIRDKQSLVPLRRLGLSVTPSHINTNAGFKAFWAVTFLVT
jgi:hypothetical protein